MKRHLQIHSERVGPTGGITADGARRPLGRPRLDPLVLVVREAIQNSWDARASERRTVQFSIDGRTLDSMQCDGLRRRFFRELPDKLPLKGAIAGGEIAVISISDRNTMGLSGPTRADRQGQMGQRDNFVEFFRNVGRSIEDAVGGGTYGYGKAALYLLSEAHTLIAYSRCVSDGQLESRLMAAALGSTYADRNGRKFTGRHWWGVLGRQDIADPLRGEEADEYASLIGLPGFEKDATGTTICIVQPRLGDARSLQGAIQVMGEATLWYCWPKLLRGTGSRPEMTVSASCDGAAIVIPRPEDHPVLKEFVGAYHLAASRDTSDDHSSKVVQIRILRPEKDLGTLGLRKFFATEYASAVPPSPDRDDTAEENPKFVQPPLHHVAMMRAPKLVVDYLEGPRLPIDQAGYAGAFVADTAMNRWFAESEPPTHDAWSFESLESREAKSCVRVALRRIAEAVAVFASPEGPRDSSGAAAPLGYLAHMLGSLLPDAPGVGAEVQDKERAQPGPGGSSAGSGGHRTRASVSITAEPTLMLRNSKPVISVPFTVEGSSAGTDEVVEVEVLPSAIVADGRAETEPPIGARSPSVVGWCDPKGHLRGGGLSKMRIPAFPKGVWTVEIEFPRNTLISTTLRVVEA